MLLRNVCVYCGSSRGSHAAYEEAARSLARALVHKQIGLVYGGARVGLMGILADAVLNMGGCAVGVIPRGLVAKEVAHNGLSELVVTESMHARKMVMAERADAFIALPGGIGTLEELFEIWTWGQLGIHEKPCGILNVASYYDRLADFLDHAVSEGFVRPRHRSMLIVEKSVDALLDRFVSYDPPNVQKWVARDET